MDKICPILSIRVGKCSCIKEECAMWGVIGYKPLYPAWQNVGDKIANGEPIDEPIYGCTTCLHIPTPLYNICGFSDCSEKPNSSET